MSDFICLQPAKLGKVELRNRIIMPPMVTNYATAKSGAMTDQYIEYLVERAKGGVGLIIVEATAVHQSGKGFMRGLCIDTDALIPKLKEMTDKVHEHGAKISIQLHHAGRETTIDFTGQQIVAPSDCPVSYSTERPHVLTKEEIEILIDDFAQAARRAKEAGFDAVQIHGAHGYLLGQFMSPYTNKRTDEYGGSLENRLRFPLEVIKRIRQAVGDDFTVTYRITVDEGLGSEGLTLEDTTKIAPILADAEIDALHVVAGNYATIDLVIPIQACPSCTNEARAEAITKAVNGKVPVVVAGKIKTIEEAERIIREKKADFIAMGRVLISEPFFIKKFMEGKTSTIRPCISCKEGCEAQVGKGLEIGCILNPRVGEEGIYSLDEKAKSSKKVIVVGAGPAGLEAACTAAERGHKVDLYEKSDRIGGMLHEASLPPFKEDLTDIAPYYQERLKEAGVKLHLNSAMDAQKAKAENADAVIVTIGAEPFIPRIEGADTTQCYGAMDVLNKKVTTGKHVVMVGGGQVGCETAEFLLNQGCKVTLVEMISELAPTMEDVAKVLMLRRFETSDIEVLLETSLSRINKDKVIIHRKGQEEVINNVDTVVWATGYKKSLELQNEFLALNSKVYFAGDCLIPGNINQAIRLGHKIAYSL